MSGGRGDFPNHNGTGTPLKKQCEFDKPLVSFHRGQFCCDHLKLHAALLCRQPALHLQVGGSHGSLIVADRDSEASARCFNDFGSSSSSAIVIGDPAIDSTCARTSTHAINCRELSSVGAGCSDLANATRHSDAGSFAASELSSMSFVAIKMFRPQSLE